MLDAMSFDEIVGNNMVILGSGETVANAILELAFVTTGEPLEGVVLRPTS